MAVYWMTEAIPIAVTALLPFAFMPWLGIIKASEVAVNYLKVQRFLFDKGAFITDENVGGTGLLKFPTFTSRIQISSLSVAF